MSSQFKKAHKTHALAQPAGVAYPGASEGGGLSAAHGGEAQRLYAELCRRLPDPAERAALLGVAEEIDAAWEEGRLLPLLRTRRRQLRAALRTVPTDPV